MLGVELSDGRRELLPGCAPLTAPEDAATFLSRRAPPKLPLLSLNSRVLLRCLQRLFVKLPVQVHFLVGLPIHSCSQSEGPSGAGRSAKAAARRPLASHRVSPENVHVCLVLFAKDDPEFLFSKVASLWRSARGKSARILCSVCWRIQWRAFWLVYAGYLQSLNR